MLQLDLRGVTARYQVCPLNDKIPLPTMDSYVQSIQAQPIKS